MNSTTVDTPATSKLPEKIGYFLVYLSLALLVIFSLTAVEKNTGLKLAIVLLTVTAGSLIFTVTRYHNKPGAINNNGVWFRSVSSRGLYAWIFGIVLTLFYVLLYWFPEVLGLGTAGAENQYLVRLFDPLSYALKGQPASQWFVYGVMYTVAILLLGFKFIRKYSGNRYQLWRTISVMFFQLVFAFLLPEMMMSLNLPYNDFKNAWPLNYYFFDGWNIDTWLKEGVLGQFVLVWGILLVVPLTPLLTYFFGKRWYCSWVCGCGGLAETAGDPFRHLSDKSLSAWKIERWMVHAVLVFAVVMTSMVLYTYFTGKPTVLGLDSQSVRQWYGFIIGALFSGVIGVGFYPLLGSRVWCRFGCPMAAYLGILQRFASRFRITTNGGQCISCGNCSTYCEMGIDVRAYAQKGQNIVRASCVGCGVCSSVCPRGVLKLENGPLKNRAGYSPLVLNDKGEVTDVKL